MTTCNCMEEKNEKLNEMGYEFSDKCRKYGVINGKFTMIYMLPLSKVGGGRMTKKDPDGVTLSYCPFCGAPLNETDGKVQP